jgi:hypothetical protein
VVTIPATAKNIQSHCRGIAVSPGVVTGELAWTAPGEAACNEVAGFVETDANLYNIRDISNSCHNSSKNRIDI